MGALIFIIIFGLAFLVTLGVAVFDRDTRVITGSVSAAVFVIMAAVIGFSTITIVPARTVGVPITFGQPGKSMGNGLHFKAPWTSVRLMDTTIQTLDAVGENATLAKDVNRADIRVHNNVRFRIAAEGAPELVFDWADETAVRDGVVQPALRTAVFDAMGSYDPLSEEQPTSEELGTEIKDRLQQVVGDRVIVESVTVTLIDFDQATLDRINQLNAERGNTRIAEQRIVTAEKQAQANQILSESVGGPEQVLVSKCLDLIEDGASLPAGFQCWPGQSETVGVIAQGGSAPRQGGTTPAPTPAPTLAPSPISDS